MLPAWESGMLPNIQAWTEPFLLLGAAQVTPVAVSCASVLWGEGLQHHLEKS